MSLNCWASLSPHLSCELHVRSKNVGGIAKVQELITKTGVSSTITSPLASLQTGNWVKLICGASFEDVADIRNLSLVYTLAGVDCIDCAAEASVVNAVNDGIEAAQAILPIRRPWVMISVNDGEDLHFRKAEFDPDDCPPDCPRPCENVCPADAIFSNLGKAGPSKGVLAERCYGRCYGCGRCLPICPYDNIRAITYVRDVAATAKLIQRDEVDAIEIHTSGRQPESFQELWSGLGDSIHKLKLVAVSLPDLGDLTIPNGFYVGNNEDEPPLPQFMAVGWPPYERRYWQRCNEGSNQICFTFSISRRQAIRFSSTSWRYKCSHGRGAQKGEAISNHQHIQ
ncbi:uncharacterized protein LOC121796074 isoform X2 [Salvia splendens]|nr:uncharacterized protein LOC121796074 isoform X2 [Salvia splendens]XP_042050727.1 uncharacterized protein LOC121796074 isoform X2 [Salvia splendens]